MENTFHSGDIVMGDAFFATYFFIASMLSKGVDILMEQQGARKRVTDFRKGKVLGQRDHLILLTKPKVRPYWMTQEQYIQAPENITVREFKAGGKILVTTLNCSKQYPKDALKTLYKQRWHVELDIRHIKDTMGMNILNCKTPEMAIKEIWITLLAYNLIRLLMAQSALLSDLTPRQISFKHCLQLWRVYLHNVTMLSDEQFHSLFLLMAQQQVGNRPGRIEPRAVKRRPKAFPLLTRNRQLACEQVEKYGHPKKLK